MILVTGGAGFIGSHISDIFINNNYKVIIIDNLSTGKKNNINEKAIFYNIDIKNYKELESIFCKNKINYVIHLAAQVSVSNSMINPLNDANENIIATINLIKLSEKYNIKKIIVASSAAVYSNNNFPISENYKTNPISYYGISKLTMENYIKLSNLDYIICRLSNVYGPRQTIGGEAGVVSIFINNLIQGRTINIFGDGKQVRDFIYVKDIANIFFKLLIRDINKIVLNISTNSSLSINELFDTIAKVANKNINLKYLDARKGDIRNSILDNSKLLKLIDINFTNIEYGIKETINYFLQNK